jgi:glycerol-3-phosphate dehydrogenase (NAD(P)+)
MSRVAVIGAGAFGTALACVVRRAGSEAVIWARDPTIADSIASDKGNPVYLPDVALEPGITATTDLAAALKGADAVLLVVPSQFLRAATEGLAPLLPAGVPVVLCAKGIRLPCCPARPSPRRWRPACRRRLRSPPRTPHWVRGWSK